MKYLLAVVSALVCVGFVGAAHHVGMAMQCFNCMGMNPAGCMPTQMQVCSNDTFPNFGGGKHCYTAVGWYMNMAGEWMSSVIRGCTNCSEPAVTKELLGNLSVLTMGRIPWGFSLMHLNVMCCRVDNCNNMTVTLLPHPTATHTSMNSMGSMSTMQPANKGVTPQAPTTDSGDYANRLSPLAFVLIAIVLLFK